MRRVVETSDIAACQAIRRRVFIEEQGVSETDEVDGLDPVCLHFLLLDDDRAVATLRIKPLGTDAKIQRVAVLPVARGTGAGAQLMREVMALLAPRGFRRAVLGSQVSAVGFYEGLGFVAEGAVYEDAGIPHRDMTRPI